MAQHKPTVKNLTERNAGRAEAGRLNREPILRTEEPCQPATRGCWQLAFVGDPELLHARCIEEDLVEKLAPKVVDKTTGTSIMSVFYPVKFPM
jgi:hypothetical protein